MALEIKTISQTLANLSNLDDLVFSDAISGYVYGLSGFSLSYPEGDRNDVLNLQVSASLLKPAGSNNRLSPKLTVVLEDDDGNTVDLDDSWVTLTVVAAVGSDSDVYLGNTGLQVSGKVVGIEPGATTFTALPLLAGFKLGYSGGKDNEVSQVNASTSLTMASSTGQVTSSAAMFDTADNHATAEADGGFLCTLANHAGLASARLNGRNTTASLTSDLGVPLSACAAFLTNFTVAYPKNDAHRINTIRIGVGTGAGSIATVSTSSPSVVDLPCAQSKMYSNGHGDYSDDKASTVDVIVIGVPKVQP